MYHLLKTLVFIIKNIPRKAGYFFFRGFGLIMYLSGGKRKKDLTTNLTNVLGSRPPESILKTIYKNYAMYYFDLFCGNEKLLRDVDPASDVPLHDALQGAIDKYGGIIVVSMHYGNWDLAAAYLTSVMPGHVTVVVEELSPAMYRWFTETRKSWGTNIVSASDLKGMIRALKNGNVLVLAADRDLNYSGYRMEFFGKKAHIPSGPAKLSLLCNVPILFGVMERDRLNPLKYSVPFDTNIINTEKLPRTDENAELITREVIKRFEKKLAQDPSQWCMLQKVWVDDTADTSK
jgi:lauroyl/myristoyl acyltransferase